MDFLQNISHHWVKDVGEYRSYYCLAQKLVKLIIAVQQFEI